MVAPEEVLKSLIGYRIVVYFNSTTNEGETHELAGFLRGYSSKWIVIQELGQEARPPQDLTLISLSTIEILRKALPGVE